MKPGDHPEFFRRPPPAGRSRESSIVLDERGRFWHDGELVQNPAMSRAFASWIGRHPDDGRYILSNGYDWTYLTVRDAPYWVQTAAVLPGGRVELSLSDGTEELLEPRSLCVGQDDALYAKVKSGTFEARFSPAAQLALADLLEALPAQNDGEQSNPQESEPQEPEPHQSSAVESAAVEEQIGLRYAGELYEIRQR